MEDTVKEPERAEVPAGPLAKKAQFGSDVIADALRALDLPYIAINPGASFRGLHDSLVNYLGNKSPQILLCMHEEHAVALAHGYAKVTGRAMAVGLHANVGLMHATMAIFNAWCDRMPVVMLGATGPVDAAKRRPWIDWIHTARDQGALIRPFTKWDDQPASVAAAQEALARAKWLAETMPCGPTYINLDSGLQEQKLTDTAPHYDFSRHMPKVKHLAGPEQLRSLAELIGQSQRPLFLMGRVSRSEADWERRIQLTEAIGARVVTDIKLGSAFPTNHALNGAAPSSSPSPDVIALLNEADLIVSFDWVDVAGTLAVASIDESCKIVHLSLDHTIHNGWSMDHQALPQVDLLLPVAPDAITKDLLELVSQAGLKPRSWGAENPARELIARELDDDEILITDLAYHLRIALGERKASISHLPLSWEGQSWVFDHPLDYVGSEGGGGIGAGPGIAVGAALALRDSGSDRVPMAICGDGDFIMGATAVWTAVRYNIPLLIVVANNCSFFNDEVHQERVALMRDRPVENKWIGMKITGPDIDISSLAIAQGATVFGPVKKKKDLAAIYTQAIEVVAQGGVAVVDVRIRPGYPPNVANPPQIKKQQHRTV